MTEKKLTDEGIIKANDILDKLDFFNQRAGRELWNEKPIEFQDADIRNREEDIKFLKDLINRSEQAHSPCEEEQKTGRYINVDDLGVDYADVDLCADKSFAEGWNSVISIIEKAPTTYVPEIKRGEWKVTGRENHLIVICSSCGKEFHSHKEDQHRMDCSNYCPYCGAKMCGDKIEDDDVEIEKVLQQTTNEVSLTNILDAINFQNAELKKITEENNRYRALIEGLRLRENKIKVKAYKEFVVGLKRYIFSTTFAGPVVSKIAIGTLLKKMVGERKNDSK